MAGAHVEREHRYVATGMTPLERDALIWALRRKGWSQAKIAHRLGMTQPGIHYALVRLAGKQRPQTQGLDMCEGCWQDVPRDQLDRDGLCGQCS